MTTSMKLASAVAEAFGLYEQTVVLHVKNLQSRSLLSAAGRGMNAARMRPIDAARLILAAAGSRLVKETVDTVEGFGKLRPITHTSRSGAGIAFEDHLAGMLTEIAARAAMDDADPSNANFGTAGETAAFVSLSLMSAFDTRSGLPHIFPRAAVARRLTERGVVTMNFADAAWASSDISVDGYARILGSVGLVQQVHVTAGALEKIALSL